MTLVLFIPYNRGGILIADRQDSYEDGTKIEIHKLHRQGTSGPAIGCSGPSTIIRKLFSDLGKIEFNQQQEACPQIIRVFEQVIHEVQRNAQFSREGLDNRDWELDTLVVEVREGQIIVSKMEGLVSYQIEENRIAAIPRIPGLDRYLNIDASTFTYEKSVLLGEEIIRQVCFTSHWVGPPEYHGYDILNIQTGNFTPVSIEGKIVQRDASQLLEYVNSKFNGGQQ